MRMTGQWPLFINTGTYNYKNNLWIDSYQLFTMKMILLIPKSRISKHREETVEFSKILRNSSEFSTKIIYKYFLGNELSKIVSKNLKLPRENFFLHFSRKIAVKNFFPLFATPAKCLDQKIKQTQTNTQSYS